MKKLLLVSLAAVIALPVMAQQAENVKNKIKEVKAPVDVACVQTAIEKRENSILTAYDTQYTAIKAALIVRKDALKNAWTLTDQKTRREAIKAVWSTFKTTKEARKAFHSARESAWKQFSAESKKCGKTVSADETGSKGSDSHL